MADTVFNSYNESADSESTDPVMRAKIAANPSSPIKTAKPYCIPPPPKTTQ
jgi:hypothetical protein